MNLSPTFQKTMNQNSKSMLITIEQLFKRTSEIIVKTELLNLHFELEKKRVPHQVEKISLKIKKQKKNLREIKNQKNKNLLLNLQQKNQFKLNLKLKLQRLLLLHLNQKQLLNKSLWKGQSKEKSHKKLHLLLQKDQRVLFHQLKLNSNQYQNQILPLK